MTNKVYLKGTGGRLKPLGKRMVTKAMYLRGKQFFLAAYLLYEKIGKEYAFLHLLCQGLEITLKSALLYKDYDKNKIQLSKPLGHNLDKILKLYLLEYGIKRIDKRISVSGNYKCEISVNRNASVSASLITDFQRKKLKNIIFKDSFSIFQAVRFAG